MAVVDDRPLRRRTHMMSEQPPHSQPPVSLQLDLAALAERVAQHVADVVREQLDRERESPWMLMEEAIDYTRVPAGTFRKWVADGRIPAHGGKRKLFHRVELDAALGYVAPERTSRPVSLPERRAS
jgi:excisionase family DNA binding protein